MTIGSNMKYLENKNPKDHFSIQSQMKKMSSLDFILSLNIFNEDKIILCIYYCIGKNKQANERGKMSLDFALSEVNLIEVKFGISLLFYLKKK